MWQDTVFKDSWEMREKSLGREKGVTSETETWRAK